MIFEPRPELRSIRSATAGPENILYIVVDDRFPGDVNDATLPDGLSVIVYEEYNGVPDLQRSAADDLCTCDFEVDQFCGANPDMILFSNTTTIGDLPLPVGIP